MAVKYKLQDVSKLTGRDIFVDANVLIYLFWSTGGSWEQKYASAFARLYKQQNSMFVDFWTIAEVINGAMRIEHKKQQESLLTTTKYKDFRDSAEGRNTLKDIYSVIKEQVLKQFKVAGKAYEQQDIESFLVVDELDFMDKSIVNICKDNNFVLLTNDNDFGNVDVDILTANSRLLNP